MPFFADLPDGMVMLWQMHSILMIIDTICEASKDFCFEYHKGPCTLSHRGQVAIMRYHCRSWLDPVDQVYAANRYHEWILLAEPRPPYNRHIKLFMDQHFHWNYCSILCVIAGAQERALEYCEAYYELDFSYFMPELYFNHVYHFFAWVDPVYQSFTSTQYFRWIALPEPRPEYDMEFNRLVEMYTPANWHYHSINMVSDGVEIDMLDWSLETYGKDIALSPQRSVDVRYYHYWASLDPVSNVHASWRYFSWQALPEPRVEYHSHIFENWFRFREITLTSVWISDYHDFCNLWCVQSEYSIVWTGKIDARDIYIHPSEVITANGGRTFEEIFTAIRWKDRFPNPKFDVCFDLALQLRCNDESIEVRALRIRIDINNPKAGILEFKLQPDEGRAGFHPTMN